MNAPLPPLQRAVLIYGSQAALARALGVTKGAVWHWTKSGQVPLNQCPRIERLVNGAVLCEELRPDFAWPARRRIPARRSIAILAEAAQAS